MRSAYTCHNLSQTLWFWPVVFLFFLPLPEGEGTEQE